MTTDYWVEQVGEHWLVFAGERGVSQVFLGWKKSKAAAEKLMEAEKAK